MLANAETYQRHRDPSANATRGGAEAFVRTLRRTKLLDVCQRVEIVLHAADPAALLAAEDTLRVAWVGAAPNCEAIWARGRASNGEARISFAAFDHSGAALLRTSCTLPSVELNLSA